MTAPAQTLTVRVPFTIRKRGGRKLAIAADGRTLAPPRPWIDSTLVKALALAHRWNRLLETGRYGCRAPPTRWRVSDGRRGPLAASEPVLTASHCSDRSL